MPVLPPDADDPRELGRYRVIGRLGEGGQGIVYLGQDPTGHQVAIKVLRTGADDKARERLARETSAAQKVAPFCTARVIEASVTGSRPYVVSEFVDGPSLLQRVSERGPLQGGELDRLVVASATALTAIHGAGIIHRDLKPANILLGPDGPRVVDFGIARPADSGTSTGLVGTPAYFAPEQLNGSPPSPAADVFAWAATMVYAATGRSPFGNDAIPAVLNRILNHEPDLNGVPENLLPLLRQCLDKDPARRPAARALLVHLVDPSAGVEHNVGGHVGQAADQALQAVTAHLPLNEPTRPVGPTGRKSAARWIAAVAGALVIASAIGVGAWLATRSHSGAAAVGSTKASSSVSAAPVGSTGTPSTDTPSTPTQGGQGPVIPADIAGTWTGTVTQTHNLLGDTLVSDVKLTLTAGKRDAPAQYTAWGCTETRTLSSISGATYVFDTATSDDPLNCSTIGTLTLTRQGDTLKYHWGTGPSGEVSDGILHKS